jgi:flagellar motility protein MotE (MotC chaperone)
MKILVTVLLTALFVFALATTWVDIVQPQLDRTAKLATEKAAVAESTPSKKKIRKALPVPAADLVPVPDEDDLALNGELPDKAPSRPRTPKGPRESAELLATRLEEVKLQESSLAARQETLKMIYDDIRTELASVGELRKRTSEDLVQAERRLSNVAEKKQPKVSGRTVPISRSPGESPASRGEALIIRRLVEEGKTETAVSLLKSMKGRDAAGVLEAISSMDPKLAVRLADTIPNGRTDTIRR